MNQHRASSIGYECQIDEVTLHDQLGPIFDDTDFTELFSKVGQSAIPPWRLALVTLMQFRENLSDRQAAEAVRSRIDWKYLLRLELTDTGFDHSVLSEFRGRLLAGNVEHLLLDKLLERCQDLGLVKAGGKQRTGSSGGICTESYGFEEIASCPRNP